MVDRGRRPKGSPVSRESRGARISQAVRSALPTSRPGARRASATADKSPPDGAFAAYTRRQARRNAARQANGAAGRWTTRRAIILLLVAGALLLTLVMPLRTYFAQLGEVKRLESEHTQLLAQLADLERQRTQQDDPGYIRAEAKRRLGFVLPGERAYKVHFPDDPEPEPIEGGEPTRGEGPWYVDLWKEIAVKTVVEPPPQMNLPIAPVEAPADGDGQ